MLNGCSSRSSYGLCEISPFNDGDGVMTVKEDLLIRHHHEADILCVTQRMHWDWASGRSGNQPASTSAVCEEYVPCVDVGDHLDLDVFHI